jgi:hypothetical protein
MRNHLSAGIKKEGGVIGRKWVLADRAYHSLAASISAGGTGARLMVAQVEVFVVVHGSSLRGAIERSSGWGLSPARSFLTILHCVDLSEEVCRTRGADTMTRIARNSVHLALPADALLTPGTLDQEIAMPPPRELRAKFLVLCPKVEMRFDRLKSLLQHMGTGSSARSASAGKRVKKRSHL